MELSWGPFTMSLSSGLWHKGHYMPYGAPFGVGLRILPGAHVSCPAEQSPEDRTFSPTKTAKGDKSFTAICQGQKFSPGRAPRDHVAAPLPATPAPWVLALHTTVQGTVCTPAA